MTEYTYKVYKNYSFRYTVSKDRYYDYEADVKSISEDTTDTVTLTDYAGLTVTNDANTVVISSGELPNYSTYAGSTFGYALSEETTTILTQSTTYGNYNIEGSPTISSGILTPATDAYVYTTFTPDISDNWTLQIKFHTPTTLDTGEVVAIIRNKTTTHNAPYLALQNVGDVLSLITSYGSSSSTLWLVYEIGEVALDTDYTVTMNYDGNTKLYQITIGETSTTISYNLESDELPFISNNQNELGIGYDWTGTIDLSETFIEVNDKYYWSPAYYKPTEYDGFFETAPTTDTNYNLFYNHLTENMIASVDETKTGYRWVGEFTTPSKFNNTSITYNYTTTGSPIFNYVYNFGNIYCYGSSFSASNYLKSTVTIPSNNASSSLLVYLDYEFIAKITTGSSVSGYQYIISENQNIGSAIIGIQGSKWKVRRNGSDITGGSVIASTKYWVAFVQSVDSSSSSSTSGIKSTLYYLVDDGTYTLDTLPDYSEWNTAITFTGYEMINNYTFSIGTNTLVSSSQYYQGSIDLTNTVIKQDGSIYWRAVE